MQNCIQALILRRFRTLASPAPTGRGFMRQKFSIAKRLLTVTAAMLVLGAGMARGADIALAPAVPDRYVVQKGDTLWGIAQKFLRDPWRWPDIWRLNRDQFKNPHWIYPGDVIVLVRGTAAAPPQLRARTRDRAAVADDPLEAARRRRDPEHSGGRSRAVPVVAAGHRPRRAPQRGIDRCRTRCACGPRRGRRGLRLGDRPEVRRPLEHLPAGPHARRL